ncbi:MAG: cyclopropane fatty acyl phospholipid synthase [Lentisphaerae bacterium]|nr:cyclopropane fatty acyl phospholipid synthase [Lentisphaerota bacterium]
MISEAMQGLLEQAGIKVNGANPWDIQVRDARLYARLWREKSLGLGQSYMDGWWDCPRVDELVCRLLRGGIQDKIRGGLRHMLRAAPWILFNLQSRARARIIAERHYDLGNDLFFSFLDPYNQYSCAYFQGTDDLNTAQLNKLAMICAKLNLSPGDRLLDIGCGWGGLARYAAERFGCDVTAVNISEEQLQFARGSCANLPVRFQNRDYRGIEGRFDKIVSVGMFEHVGWKNYREFFDLVFRRLEERGIFLLHTIGRNESGRGGAEPWMSKYIFPNSMLPSIAQIARAAEGRFVIEDLHNLGPHYDKTLMAWNANFQQAWPRLSGRYDARFKRMWEYYLLCCAGAFRSRDTHVWQILMTRRGSGRTQPACGEGLEASAVGHPEAGAARGWRRAPRRPCANQNLTGQGFAFALGAAIFLLF